MTKLAPLAALAAAALGLGAASMAAADDVPRGEAKLAKMLEGRVAGEPQSCINTFPSRALTQIDDTALVYREGRTLWVNRTRTPDAIDDDDYLVIRKFGGTRLCRTDQVETYSRPGNFFSGVIFLGDFVPYRLADDTDG